MASRRQDARVEQLGRTGAGKRSERIDAETQAAEEHGQDDD